MSHTSRRRHSFDVLGQHYHLEIIRQHSNLTHFTSSLKQCTHAIQLTHSGEIVTHHLQVIHSRDTHPALSDNALSRHSPTTQAIHVFGVGESACGSTKLQLRKKKYIYMTSFTVFKTFLYNFCAYLNIMELNIR